MFMSTTSPANPPLKPDPTSPLIPPPAVGEMVGATNEVFKGLAEVSVQHKFVDCCKCNRPGATVKFEGQPWHAKCLECESCFRRIISEAEEKSGKISLEVGGLISWFFDSVLVSVCAGCCRVVLLLPAAASCCRFTFALPFSVFSVTN